MCLTGVSYLCSADDKGKQLPQRLEDCPRTTDCNFRTISFYPDFYGSLSQVLDIQKSRSGAIYTESSALNAYLKN